LLDTPHFTAAVTGGAGNRAAAWFSATSMTLGANLWPAYLNLFFGAKNSFLERDAQIIAQIRAAAGATPPSATAAGKTGAKQIFKNIGKTTKALKPGKSWSGPIFYSGMAITVIGCPRLLVRQHFICPLYLFEPFFRIRLFVYIRVILAGFATVRLFDFLFIRAALYTQNLVKISLSSHMLKTVPGKEQNHFG
jgi:hypothetical protein